ncbi:hypothetical protein D1007_46473 [Hordeum vulgare]|nr:hypothetical protein D1007_46473 [Hordeum vulgare]
MHPFPHYAARSLNGQVGRQRKPLANRPRLLPFRRPSPPGSSDRGRRRHRARRCRWADPDAFATLSTMPPGSSNTSRTRGAWDGSDVGAEHIEFLHHRHKLPLTELVAARLPGAENSLSPKAVEVVVFAEHFALGIGLMASNLFFIFLTHFGLQQHHLAANAVLQLGTYVTLCKGFLGIESRLDLWRRLFYFKQQSVTHGVTDHKLMTPCAAALVHHRTGSGFPKLPLQDSVKKWERGFFYVKNVNPQDDHINRPPFINVPLTEKLNWQSDLPHPVVEVKLICTRLGLLEVEGLTVVDLLAIMVACRILPLQRRLHLMC